jgi:hypothetical protein
VKQCGTAVENSAASLSEDMKGWLSLYEYGAYALYNCV